MKYIKASKYFENYPTVPIDINSFPEEIKRTLDEYDIFMDFDWNLMVDKHGKNFNTWLKNFQNEQFQKNIKTIISHISQDMIMIKKRGIAEKKLKYFEELIKDTLGKEVLSSALSKFEEEAIMNPYATEVSLKRAFDEAKNIIDSDGNINQDKVTKSTFFSGGDINLHNFERFVKKNPEFEGVFNDWEKLFDESTELSLKDLHAFRSSTSVKRMWELRKFLLNLKI